MVLTEIMLIISGFVLLSAVLYLIPGVGASLTRLALFLGTFQAFFGIVAILVAILGLFSLAAIVLLVAGLILVVGILPVIPAFGEGFKNFVKALAAFQVPIGIIAILLGFLGLVT